jgi:hypothetical protein
VSSWYDNWLDDRPLCQSYPILHELCWNQQCSVLDVKNAEWVVEFREKLQGVIRGQWYELAGKLNNVRISDDKDITLWKWTANKRFSVKSVYDHLSRDESDPNYKRIWKAKIPEKIKKFMWLVERQAILTKDNMVKRRWQVDPGCFFCGALESPNNLLFTCPIGKVVWGVAMCFHQRNRPSSYDQF